MSDGAVNSRIDALSGKSRRLSHHDLPVAKMFTPRLELISLALITGNLRHLPHGPSATVLWLT
jgi:hypothetical protein